MTIVRTPPYRTGADGLGGGCVETCVGDATTVDAGRGACGDDDVVVGTACVRADWLGGDAGAVVALGAQADATKAMATDSQKHRISRLRPGLLMRFVSILALLQWVVGPSFAEPPSQH